MMVLSKTSISEQIKIGTLKKYLLKYFEMFYKIFFYFVN